MRGKKENVEIFYSKDKEQDRDKLIKLIESQNEDYYLGVRENYLNIYYKGMSIAKIEAYKRKSGFKYTSSYCKGVIDENGEKISRKKETLQSKVFWKEGNLDSMKKNVEDHVFGYDPSHKTYLEKVCQQWLINRNNKDADSQWYYIDMEYEYKDSESKAHPYGRADLIAIKKKPNKSGIYETAFIELKVGLGAYGSSLDIPKNIKNELEKNDKSENDYKEEFKKKLKENLWDESIMDQNMGSGILSHIVDFLRFFKEDFYQNNVRQEIINIINFYKEYRILDGDKDFCDLDNIDKISDKPLIYIVTYSDAQSVDPDVLFKEKKEKKCSLKDMKVGFYNYFYDTNKSSIYSVEDMLGEKDIEGFIKCKPEYKKFIEEDDKDMICMKQRIGNGEYEFRIKFVDVDKNKEKLYHCL